MREVLAPIVGNVWQIHTHVGDQVESGQVLMVLESMKMEIPITAPVVGTVTSLPVDVNQIVQEGAILAVLNVSS